MCRYLLFLFLIHFQTNKYIYINNCNTDFDVSLYSEKITGKICKNHWFKTIVKTLMFYG